MHLVILIELIFCKLEIIIKLPNNINLKDREWLIQEGCECPVCHSVNQTMEVEITFDD